MRRNWNSQGKDDKLMNRLFQVRVLYIMQGDKNALNPIRCVQLTFFHNAKQLFTDGAAIENVS